MPTKGNQDLLDLRQPSDKKASKPLMEKRRRARINHSLAQLKALVIDPNTTERTRQTKLEKADILELTVRHLYEIKRQQRTALMLETRHPKKKFEIGYAECAREVELFLSNLINPQSSGVDGELQRRLKDHLNKRLQDFRNIEPLESNSKKEASDEELNNEEPTSSPSCVSNCLDDVPLSADPEETNSSDSSALSTMLKYYANDKKTVKTQDISTYGENPSPKRLKKIHKSSNEEESGIPFSCQSVTSTTGSKLSDVSSELSGVEKYSENIRARTMAKTFALKECFTSYSEASDLSDSPHVICTSFRNSALKKKSSLSSSSYHSKREVSDYFDCVPSDKCHKVDKNGEPTTTRSQKLTEQIPLVPRQLANGDWALVLPASLVPSEKEESYPFSAFRLVVPTCSTSPDPDTDSLKQRLHSSSPLSSTVSDVSVEEYCSRSIGDPVERVEHGSPDSTQMVWRPW